MNEQLIRKYIRGVASLQEKEAMVNWLEQDERNQQVFHSLKADWVFNNLPDGEASRHAYHSVRKKIGPLRASVGLLLKVAATLFIPIVLFSVYQYVTYSKNLNTLDRDRIAGRLEVPVQNRATIDYHVNPGVKGVVDLPDGSRVWLNSDSKLKCPGQFDSTFRMVELRGEGYFSVIASSDWPMYVKTSKGITVKVTGTEFNVSSYDNDHELKFTLVSGNVTLIREHDRQEIAVTTLEEVIIPDNTGERGTRRMADIMLNTGWKDGYLVFENTPMDEVIKKMERWYGVQFRVTDNRMMQYAFTATFKSESITQVLHLLELTSNIGHSLKDNEVTLFFRQ